MPPAQTRGRYARLRLPSETIQRNPDRPEVHHAAERFKAVPGEPVVTEKLPYDLKVVGAGEVNGPPVPIQEPFEHLSRRVGLEDVGDGGPIEIPDVPEAQPRLSENPPFARVNDLLKRLELSHPSRFHEVRWGGVEIDGGSG